MAVDLDRIAQGVRMILEGIGEDLERAGLRETPQRVAEMYAELTSPTFRKAVAFSGFQSSRASRRRSRAACSFRSD